MQNPDSRLFSPAEVGEHNNADDLWIIVNGQVFDITAYQHDHPGGEKVFKKVAGVDATKQFLKNHKFSTIDRFRDEIFIGTLKKDEGDGEKTGGHGGLFGLKSRLSKLLH
jgi:cytochrome b involved in lipid metabolism